MASTQHAISEHDVVRLLNEAGGWSAGTVGTVVSDYGSDALVEVVDHRGRTKDLVRVPISCLRLCSD